MSTERILVVSAHPDDEALGCGATLLQSAARGAEIHWIIATETWAPKWTDEYRRTVLAESNAVGKRIAPGRVQRLGLPAARLDMIPLTDLIDPLIAAIREIRPRTIFSVGPHDVSSDHQIVFRALEIAVKPLYASVERWLTFELPGSTDWAVLPAAGPFVPNVFIDVTETLEAKLDLASLYATELREAPHPRSRDGIKALARMRGLSVGCEYAEAFELCREILR